jgi:hypothetical protein
MVPSVIFIGVHRFKFLEKKLFSSQLFPSSFNLLTLVLPCFTTMRSYQQRDFLLRLFF